MATGYLDFNSGSVAGTLADDAAFDLANDAEWRYDFAADDWTPGTAQVLGARWVAAGNLRNWRFQLQTSGNILVELGDSAGVARTTFNATISEPANGARLQLRITIDADNGSTQTAAAVYTRTGGAITDLEDNTGWTLDFSGTIAGVQSWLATANPIRLASADPLGQPLFGKFYRVIHWSDMTQTTKVYDVDFEDSANMPTGNPAVWDDAARTGNWAINGTQTTNYLWVDETGPIFFDAATESSAWTTTPDPFTFSHTGNSPTWALLFVVQNTAATDDIDGVPTYGGVSMPRIGSVAAHNIGLEPGRVYAFFTDAPGNGSQTVSIPHTAAANTRIATVITGTGTSPVVSTRQGNTGWGARSNLTQRVVTATDAQRYAVLFSGTNAPANLTPLSGMTAISDHDYTNQSALVARSTVNATDMSIGYTAIDDDYAQFAVAIEPATVTQAPVLYRYLFDNETTAHLITLPLSPQTICSLASAAFSVNGTQTIATPGGWTRFDNDTSSSTLLSGMFWKECDGSETTADFVTSISTGGTGGVHVWHIPAELRDITQDPENTTVGPTASGTPDPGSLTPSWGSAANHWFVVLARDQQDGISSLGANYALRFQYDAFTGAERASSWYINTATSEDPPASTVATTDEEFKAYTLAVKPPGDDSVTGTGTSTLEDVTSAGSGVVANPVSGTGTSTLGGVTSAGTGVLGITGTGTSTLGDVTSAGSGIVANPVSGTGTSLLDGVTSAGTGNIIQPVSGTGSSTLSGVTSAGTGTLGYVGVGASTLGGVTSQGTGLTANPITGTGTSTLDGVTSTGTGSALAAGHIENVVCDLLAPVGTCDDLAPTGVCDSYGPVCVGTMTP